MKQKVFFLFASIAWLFTASIAFRNVLSSSIPFWYDPARDMLSAWDNLHKLTLIGPTSGIPGIFYGPYWIWWLSIGQLVSKDPKIVDLLMLTIPYLIGFPLVLFLFSKVFGRVTSVLLWLLFFYTSQSYMIFLWNPHLAPLLFLAVIYLLVVTQYKEFSKKTLLSFFLSGILSGLALNIHISFSVGFVLGCLLFIVINSLLSNRRNIQKSLFHIILYNASFIVGIFITFLPFLLFEVRHGFNQTKTAFNAFVHGGAVVTLHGLSKPEIISQYFLKFSSLLQVPIVIGLALMIISTFVLVILSLQKKISFTSLEFRLISLLGCITFGVLGVYLSAKNPIWGYHFIGADVIALLFIGFLVAKIKPLQYVLLLWVILLTGLQIGNLMSSLHANPFVSSALYTEEYIVRTIQNDAKQSAYTVYVYSPSIYSYEYSYLFRYMAHKDVSYDPGLIKREGTVYLILPKAKQVVLTDFINFRSPQNTYKTTKIWHVLDGTTIIRRSQI